MDMLELEDPRLAVLKDMQIPVWIFDVDDSRIRWANSPALAHWRANSPEELYRRDFATDMSVSVRERLRQIRAECVAQGNTFSENWTLYPDNEPHTVEAVMSAFELSSDRAGLMIQIIEEVRHASSETLRSAQALLHTSAMISLYDDELNLLYSNPAARAIACCDGQSLPELLVEPSDLLTLLGQIDKHGSCDLEAQVCTRTGTAWHSLNVRTSPDSVTGQRSLLVSSYDITDRRNAQREVYLLASTDSLTGLPNRLALMEHLQQLCDSDSGRFAVLFLDLDRFKLVNDSLGHAVGDRLLQAVASRLNRCADEYRGFVSRLGGDEFVIVLNGFESSAATALVAQCVLDSLDCNFDVDGHQMGIQPSIGICLYPAHGDCGTTLMQHADVAMYAAKQARTGYRFFNSRMNDNLQSRLELERDLTEAIRRQEFELYYQPKISAQDGRISGMEALVRWFHPDKGMISPLQFISIAEETGKIISIGHWVMREAMIQQREWARQGYDICISVNVSAVQINSHGFVQSVVECLREVGCDAGKIEFEITESLLLADSGYVLQILHDLSALGVRLAIDDFGTGYSNLAYLQKYPLHCLKIDRTFLVDMEQTAILEMILTMGKMLGLSVVAEGVETDQQISWLRDHHCDELQGFYFSKPVSVGEATRYIELHSPAVASLQVA
jgi:diguanylate cyclase (GGDEF)-like protein